MAYRRQSVPYREKLINDLLKTPQFQAIVELHNFTEGLVRVWARNAVKTYLLYNVEVDEKNPRGLKIDGKSVEQLILDFQEKRKQKVQRGSYKFNPLRYPEEPGCYLMKNACGEVIYVGKAKNLRKRLSSYFRRTLDWKKTEMLVEEIADIEVMIVNNEPESLFLENNLIKLHQPKYNRRLIEEDTGYAYIILTGEEFPRLSLYRKGRVNRELQRVKGRPGEKRFGPFLNADLLLEISMEHFKLRTCKTMPTSVCLSYHLGRCSGICKDYVSPEEYREAVRKSEVFLSYKPGERISEMKGQMLEYAERLEFEKAQKLKKQIEALQSTLEKQIVERDIKHNQDVVYFGEEQVLITNIECGMIINMCMYELEAETEGYTRACEEFLVRHYGMDCPKELIINHLSTPSCERVEKVLSVANGYKVTICLPKKGVKHDLLKLCERNYKYRVSEEVKDENGATTNRHSE